MLFPLLQIDMSKIPVELASQFTPESLQKLVDDAIKQKKDFAPYQPQTFVEAMEAFTSAVQWKNEAFLFYLAFFLLSFLFVVISLRRSVPGLFIALLACFGFVLGAHPLNSYASNHWQSFSTQNYFDESGFFILVMYCVPLLFIALIDLVFILIQTSELLVKVKQLELKEQRSKKTE